MPVSVSIYPVNTQNNWPLVCAVEHVFSIGTEHFLWIWLSAIIPVYIVEHTSDCIFANALFRKPCSVYAANGESVSIMGRGLLEGNPLI